MAVAALPASDRGEVEPANRGPWPVWGHERQVDVLRRAIGAGRPSHAYLFTGPHGVGKRTLARAFAAALLCRAEGRDDPTVPCGACASCRKIARGTHPDVETYGLASQIEAAEKSGARNTSVTIDTVRRLRAATALKPLEGERRFVVLDDAEAMQEPAQEALLKTLEEPPSAVTMILLASDSDQLLPTIRSRCQIVALTRLAPATIVAGLRSTGVDRNRALAIAGVAHGSAGWAITAAGDEAIWRERGDAVDRAIAWVAGNEYDRLVTAVRLADGFAKRRDQTFREVEAVLGVWRDALLLRLGLASHLANADRREQIGRIAEPWTLDAVLGALSAVQRCLADLEANVRTRLAMEAMVLAWPPVDPGHP